MTAFAVVAFSRRPSARKENMQTITRILCPTDFSDSSAKATSYAEQLARETNAELLLFHAFDPPANWTLSGQEHPRDPHIQQELDAVLRDSPHQPKIGRLLHAGDPGQVICWIAQDHQCDLIVIGTHGRTGMKHLLFGSVAEYVLQHARCPVLSIRDRAPNEMPLARPLNLPVMAPRFM
jgi:universal stress protein A